MTNELKLNNFENELNLPEKKKEEKIFTFLQISSDVYAINSLNVLEIIKLLELSVPEKLPSHIAGLFEYDGKFIPVVDIRSILGLEQKPYSINSMVVILQSESCRFGVIVNKVIDIKRIDAGDIQNSPYETKTHFIESIYSNEIFQCAVLNLENIGKWVLEHNDDETISSTALIPKDEKSLEILARRKEDYIEKSQKNPYIVLGDKDEFVTFEFSGNKYCLKMEDIKGFYKLQNTKMTKVPCTPPFVLGLVNIKGEFITVIDIKSFFHAQQSDFKGYGTIIVLNSDEFKVGILTDLICDNLQIKPEEIKNLNKQEAHNELSQYVKDGEIYLIINIKEMLANEKLYVK